MPPSTPLWTSLVDFHIEKSRLPVVVVTSTGDRLAGDLFVQSSPRNPAELETAPELLNSHEDYFPLGMPGGRALLCAKRHVREVRVPRALHGDGDWEFAVRAQVTVAVAGGMLLKGTILIEQEMAHQRVLDFLNRWSQRFLPVYTGDEVVLVNREYILLVEQVN